MLADVELAYQNLDSVELGVTSVDNYFDTLGGISRAVRRAKGGAAAPVYIGDQTRGEGTVRTLSEQVAFETRTRILNPKWYEGMLKHGYEGVRQIETHVTNTMGWSATTGDVAPWVYQKITETYLLDPAMRDRLAKPQPDRRRQGRRPPDRGASAQLLDARRRDPRRAPPRRRGPRRSPGRRRRRGRSAAAHAGRGVSDERRPAPLPTRASPQIPHGEEVCRTVSNHEGLREA